MANEFDENVLHVLRDRFRGLRAKSSKVETQNTVPRSVGQSAVQLNVRVRPETKAALQHLADLHGWSLAVAIERAIDALAVLNRES